MNMQTALRITGIFFVLSMIVAPVAHAQESIFVPMPTTESEPQEAPVNDDALSNWIKLQADLYKIVLTFDEKAKLLERNILHNEQVRLNNDEIRFKALSANRKPNESGNYGGEEQIYSSTLCSELNDTLNRYIDKNTSALDGVVKKIVAETASMDETQKASYSQRIQVAVAAIPNLRRSQEILYLCLYKYKTEAGVPAAWSLEKTLRKWNAVQVPILDAWLGNVD